MNKVTGNIWDFHDAGNWIVIPVNGQVNSKGEAIMGAGLAKQAKDRFPDLPALLGANTCYRESWPFAFHSYKIISFPTKYKWREDSNLGLIEQCLREGLKLNWLPAPNQGDIYLPRLGCGERTGRLQWKDVKSVLEKYLDDRFIVVTLPGEAE